MAGRSPSMASILRPTSTRAAVWPASPGGPPPHAPPAAPRMFMAVQRVVSAPVAVAAAAAAAPRAARQHDRSAADAVAIASARGVCGPTEPFMAASRRLKNVSDARWDAVNGLWVLQDLVRDSWRSELSRANGVRRSAGTTAVCQSRNDSTRRGRLKLIHYLI